MMEKPLGHYFQGRSPYCQAAQCNQKHLSISTNHSYHRSSSPWANLNWSNNKAQLSKLRSVIGHHRPDFQSDWTIFSWNLQKWAITEWHYLGSEVWQNACFWHGRWIEKEKLVNWVLSLHAKKIYEAKVNSFCMCKLLIKINILQRQL